MREDSRDICLLKSLVYLAVMSLDWGQTSSLTCRQCRVRETFLQMWATMPKVSESRRMRQITQGGLPNLFRGWRGGGGGVEMRWIKEEGARFWAGETLWKMEINADCSKSYVLLTGRTAATRNLGWGGGGVDHRRSSPKSVGFYGNSLTKTKCNFANASCSLCSFWVEPVESQKGAFLLNIISPNALWCWCFYAWQNRPKSTATARRWQRRRCRDEHVKRARFLSNRFFEDLLIFNATAPNMRAVLLK